ncbi:hypothetical protein Stsp01_64440 [Streptomyces sp. NBRC 13847]|uniref:hypothetical protein n=1 Tax=Streptomyces TaxID=1883 RepID=UPI0024A44E91|nr:hypothetical protein [Streptomyces sp. NBRC 13847]GLW19701.1 hypothetical protein Stsp01_64440 [Streptomyces sp. NBRC 13847]
MTASMTSVLARPRAGLQEVEREGGNKPEGAAPRLRHAAKIRTSAEVRLGTELLSRVRSADAQIPVSRRVPRTVAEMRARIDAAHGATEDDLNRDLDNPSDDWDLTVLPAVLPRAAGGDEHLGKGSPEASRSATNEVTCPFCSESNEEGSACKRCGH